jgi:hypothetical protein
MNAITKQRGQIMENEKEPIIAQTESGEELPGMSLGARDYQKKGANK